MRSPPLRRKTTCEKHDLVQSGKSSLKSWPGVKLIPQANKQTNNRCAAEYSGPPLEPSLSLWGRGGTAGSVFTLHACRGLDQVPAGAFYHLLFITCTQKQWSLLITLKNIARTFNSNNHLLGSGRIALCFPDSILRFLFQEQNQLFSDIITDKGQVPKQILCTFSLFHAIKPSICD